MSTTRLARRISGVLLASLVVFLTARMPAAQPSDTRLIGDWDYYVMLGAAPNGGFEARRRMGFAHFDGPSANGAARQRIVHDTVHPSFVRLPIIPR